MRNPFPNAEKLLRHRDEVELMAVLDGHPRKTDDPESHPASMKIERGPTMKRRNPSCLDDHPAPAYPAERGPTMQERLELMEPLVKMTKEG